MLFCDEATSALDPQTTRSILSLIKELHQKLKFTVVIITHQMEVNTAICEELAVLSDGRIAEQATHDAVFSAPKTAAAKDLVNVP